MKLCYLISSIFISGLLLSCANEDLTLNSFQQNHNDLEIESHSSSLTSTTCETNLEIDSILISITSAWQESSSLFDAFSDAQLDSFLTDVNNAANTGDTINISNYSFVDEDQELAFLSVLEQTEVLFLEGLCYFDNSEDDFVNYILAEYNMRYDEVSNRFPPCGIGCYADLYSCEADAKDKAFESATILITASLFAIPYTGGWSTIGAIGAAPFVGMLSYAFEDRRCERDFNECCEECEKIGESCD